MRAVLDGLRLTGAVFLRAEYTENWAYESLPVEDVASALVPDARRVTLFHVVASGRCWVEVDSGERHWASAGDVIVLPYGDSHRMGGLNDAELVSAASLRHAAAVVGDAGDPLRRGRRRHRRRLRLPHLRRPALRPGAARAASGVRGQPDHADGQAFVRANIDYALQQTSLVGDDKVEVSTEVPRLLLTEILRIHLASAPASQSGWLLALRDPVLAPALAALHADPGRKWTVAELARASLVSASSLDQRFRDVLGMPPIRYLTVWRMHTARSLLSSTELAVAGGGAPGRLRLRGGVQPGLQARPRRLAEPVAGRDERRGLSAGLSRRRGGPGRPPRPDRCPSARCFSAYSCAACRAACSTPSPLTTLPARPAGLDDAEGLELAVGARDGVGGQAEIAGEPAYGRQLRARAQLARLDLGADLLAHLLVRRDGGRVVDGDHGLPDTLHRDRSAVSVCHSVR